MPMDCGRKAPWKFPPNDPKPAVVLEQCPVKFITPDVHDLFHRLNLADGKISFSEQDRLPYPYRQAALLALREQNKAMAERIKKGG